MRRVEDGKEYPPFFLVHDTGDPVMPCQQMEELYTRLKEANAKVEARYVDNAEHEGNFWSPEVSEEIHSAVLKFLKI